MENLIQKTHSKRKRKKINNKLIPWIMIIPSLVFTILLIGFPIIYGIYLMFVEWSPGASIWGSTFIGVGNIMKTFSDKLFWSSFWITIKISGISLFFEIIIGVYLAILLSKAIRGIKLLRIMFFYPSIAPQVAAGMIWVLLFDPSLGLINYVLESINLPVGNWLNDPSTVIYALAIVDIWQWTPFIALIVLGGIQALPEEPFEAAVIDGATKFQTLIYITLPLLKSIIIVALMLRSVDMFRIFDSIYVMTQGGPINSSTSLNIYAYKQGFLYTDMGVASTAMFVLLIFVILVSFILANIRKRME